LSKSICIAITIGLAATALWFFGYRDTTEPPHFTSENFQDVSLQTALQTIADATHAGGAPGVILLVRHNDTNTIATAGTANKKTGIPMPANHALRIASISKVYIASLAVDLAARGTLDLDTPINTYLPETLLEGLPNADTFSPRQLLQHTSGVPVYRDLRSYLFADWHNTPISLERMLPMAKRNAPTGPPDTSYSYSDMGYVLLGSVIEAVSGQSLPDLIDSKISELLSLTATHYNIKHASPDSIHGYGTLLRPWADTYQRWEHSGPDAGITASADETARFLDALFLQTGGPLADIGAQMISSTIPVNTNETRGLGAHIITTSSNDMLVGHSGSVPGYQSFAYALPSQDAVIFGHINCDCDGLSGALLWNTYAAVTADAPNIDVKE